MTVAPVGPLHTLSWVTRPEVGNSALAAWLACRVATVKFSGPFSRGGPEVGPGAALKPGHFGDYSRRPGDPIRRSLLQSRGSFRVHLGPAL